MSTNNSYQHLEPRPGSLYRQLFLKGTRIRAEIIYSDHVNAEMPRTPEEIAADRSLPLPAVLDAIEYCRSKPPEIAEDHAREEAIAAASGELDPNYKYNPKPRILTPEEWARLLAPCNSTSTTTPSTAS